MDTLLKLVLECENVSGGKNKTKIKIQTKTHTKKTTTPHPCTKQNAKQRILNIYCMFPVIYTNDLFGGGVVLPTFFFLVICSMLSIRVAQNKTLYQESSDQWLFNEMNERGANH